MRRVQSRDEVTNAQPTRIGCEWNERAAGRGDTGCTGNSERTQRERADRERDLRFEQAQLSEEPRATRRHRCFLHRNVVRGDGSAGCGVEHRELVATYKTALRASLVEQLAARPAKGTTKSN